MNARSSTVFLCAFTASCGGEPENPASTPSGGDVDPPFRNSIVSTDIDFITEADASAFSSLAYIGRDDREMPDRRHDELFDTDTFVFEAAFSDGGEVGIWLHSAFGDVAAAQAYARKVSGPLGRLPGSMRATLSHVVVHVGDETAFGEHLGHFFVLYADNIDERIRDDDLEETVFHESVHATLDATHADSAAWRSAQARDGAFITDYARDDPGNEDLAESALFAYTMLKHPGRLPGRIENWIGSNMPDRLAFFRTLFSSDL